MTLAPFRAPAGTRHPADPVAVAAAWSRRLAVGAATVGAALAVLAPGAWTATAVLLVAGAWFVAGVPHGAVDHLLLARLGRRSLLGAVAVYGAAAAAAWALLQWAGPVALVAAVVLAVVHFGLGEVEVLRALTGWRPGRVVTAALAVAGSGALLLPLARSGDVLGGVARAVSPGLAELLAAGPVRAGLAGVWVAAAAVAVVAALRAGHRAPVVDVVLVGALGLALPPLVAFAVWFGGWHALRHAGRLLVVEPGCAALVAAGRPGAATARLARSAALPTAVALAALAGLLAATTAAPDPQAAVAELLRALLALTVPHELVVLWLDRRARRPG